MQVEENAILPENDKKNIRRRKKQLYNSIRRQMEFYFSDANLRKDRFIGQIIKVHPYVDLTLFLTFNKISVLTNKLEELVAALEKSNFLKLSDDKTQVCRVTPVGEKENEDDCTIYVERLPEDTVHDWLQDIFSTFGKVEYVSLPKYKHNKRHKGFAFIEFDQPEAAQKAIEYFETIGCKLPIKMPPGQLVSITAFETENTDSTKNDDNTEEIVSEEAQDKNENNESETKEELKHDEEVVENTTEKRKRKSSPDGDDCEDAKKLKHESATDEQPDKEDEVLEKKKRKRRKAKKHGCDFKQIGLRVLSKREWKQLRNKYLNMQRTKMKILKDHFRRNRYPSNEIQADSECSKEKYENETHAKHMEQESEPRFKFSPGCIISFTLPEPCDDVKKFKADLRVGNGIEYVDVDYEMDRGFIRFTDNELLKKFIESPPLEMTVNVLEGDEETAYWDKVMADRKYKLQKSTGKKVRGREKLLKKAERELGKHIKFES